MRVLVLEDDSNRVISFIEKFGNHSLLITEDAFEAIVYLDEELFDYIFLDYRLGKDSGSGFDVVNFLENESDNLNNNVNIIIHSWDVAAVGEMLSKLPNAVYIPFGSDDFFNLSLT
jgi:ActR/RegA family two-component response regulator